MSVIIYYHWNLRFILLLRVTGITCSVFSLRIEILRVAVTCVL